MPSPPAPSDTRRPSPIGLTWTAVPSLVGFVLAGVFLLRANTITGPEATYPVVLAIAVLVVGLVNVVRDLTAPRSATSDDEDDESAESDGPTAVARTVAFVVVLLATVVLLEPLGFFPAMVVMAIGSLLSFGMRDPFAIAAATALIVGCAYLVFVRLLVVPFPPGFLELT